MGLGYSKSQEDADVAALQQFYDRQKEREKQDAWRIAEEIEKKILAPSPEEEVVEWDVEDTPKQRPLDFRDLINRNTMLKICIPGGEELDMKGYVAQIEITMDGVILIKFVTNDINITHEDV